METIKTINSFKEFVESPLSSIGVWAWGKAGESAISLIDGSYWLFLGVSMSALFLYVAGEKGARKYATSPPLIYLLLQLLKISLK